MTMPIKFQGLKSRLGWLWFRGRFYLSGLVLILPAMAFPFYFVQATTPPLGSTILPEREVGPFRVTLAEFMPGPPIKGPCGHMLKDYQLHIADGYPERIRSVWIRVGPPPNARTLGEIMHGNPYRLHGHARFMAPPRTSDQLWLTIEEWDGSLHQTWWPLPATMTQVSFDTSEGK